MLRRSSPAAAPFAAAAWSTAVLWFAAAFSGVYWALQFPDSETRTSVAVAAGPVSPDPHSSADVARALADRVAAPAATKPEDARFQLLGVIASGSGQGSALMAVAGEPPKAFRVGQTLTEGVVLQNVSAKQARLGTSLNGPAVWVIPLLGSD